MDAHVKKALDLVNESILWLSSMTTQPMAIVSLLEAKATLERGTIGVSKEDVIRVTKMDESLITDDVLNGVSDYVKQAMDDDYDNLIHDWYEQVYYDLHNKPKGKYVYSGVMFNPLEMDIIIEALYGVTEESTNVLLLNNRDLTTRAFRGKLAQRNKLGKIYKGVNWEKARIDWEG